MQLTCICEAKWYCIIYICGSIERLLISLETGKTVFDITVSDANVSDDKQKQEANYSLW